MFWYTNQSSNVIRPEHIWAMVACDMVNVHGLSTTAKEGIVDFMKTKVCRYTAWGEESKLKQVLVAVDELIADATRASSDAADATCPEKKMRTMPHK